LRKQTLYRTRVEPILVPFEAQIQKPLQKWASQDFKKKWRLAVGMKRGYIATKSGGYEPYFDSGDKLE
jgi:hypothetical protein